MTQSKAEIIDERKANLPLPEQPPVASDWNSADARTVNVGSGGVEADIDASGAGSAAGLREPASTQSDVRVDGAENKTGTAGSQVGRQAADGLSGLPSDALAGKAKNSAAATETRGKDYGYPSKSDPSSGP